ncbi:serine/threonine-protein kinase [Stigmatella sp. ncwal1]|uniref:Serine/threonine-protein kinase n=1 Tax=Stigmatella ashevillensis TaxID=2995309 RepID=A0ABT5D4C3_9BACT|nr:serine/threonine-protein kinase [Stigmatella ashevillena]MDC0708522.1 serine/threonine-protein kinase [Stigmatella ashevillena]
MTLSAGAQIGKYIVRRKLAEGGMAEIYLCTAQGAEGFEKEVVIKQVRPFLASDPGFVEMFIAEARLASRLNHANVVQIFDFAKHEDTYYLAMEYVRGCTLWDLRRKCKEQREPMPPVLVAHIGVEVARGLHYAHRLRVNGEPLFLVHRDVTPHNVLLSFEGAVKLTDFGIAKAGNKMTSPGMLKGKFAYMSPEQSRGENVDARTDVFALGVVLWEMLTGGRLFDGDSELAVLRAVQESVIPEPSRLNPEVPGELGEVVMKALCRDVSARYQTAAEFERALAQCVLNHAQSVDDTDVGGFLRRLFGGAPSMALQALSDRTQHAEAGAGPQEGRVPEPGSREPTAVLPGSRSRSAPEGSGRPSAPSPDEDVHAPTHRVSLRGGEPSAAVQGGLEVPVKSSEARRKAALRRPGRWPGLGLVALVAATGVGVLVTSLRSAAPPRSGGEGERSQAFEKPAASAVTGPEARGGAAPPPATPPRVSSPEPKPAMPSVGERAAAAVEAPPPSVTAAPLVKGRLVVKATPYATVLVNGRSLGEVLGRKVFPLAPGSYQLTLTHPKETRTESITIVPDGTVTREFRARMR